MAFRVIYSFLTGLFKLEWYIAGSEEIVFRYQMSIRDS